MRPTDMTRTGFLGLTLTVAVLAAAPAARAATVSGQVVSYCSSLVCSKYMGGEPRTLYRFSTEPGERSTATVARIGSVLQLHDETAPVTAGALCRQVDGNTVSCDTAANAAPLSLTVTGGSGDDVLVVATPLGLETSLDGGPGADDIRSGPDGETLSGGAGSDRLSGGGGDDTLRGDGSSASMTPAPAGRDTIDGGEGTDLVSYSERGGPVDVDLRRLGAGNGATGEGDAIANVERLEGGGGDDALAGDDGPNLLLGGGGADTLRAGGGADELDGGQGRDVLDSGAGDDLLEPADDESDDLRCRSGVDTISDVSQTGEYEDDVTTVGPDAADVVHRDCELTVVEDDSEGSLLRVAVGAIRLRGGRTLVLPNPCRSKRRCRTAVTVRPRAGSRRSITRSTRDTRAATVELRLSGSVAGAARRGRVAIALRITRGELKWAAHFTSALDGR